jgi:hypothetical protein
MCWPHREQARSHIDFAAIIGYRFTRNSPVGAGLLAKRACQVNHCQLTHRIREQARSHIDSAAIIGYRLTVNPVWERACSR